MKQAIHPQYYSNIKITCACGAIFETGSTKESIQTEICSACHPFYTGKSKYIDSAGRVERFKIRQAKTQVIKEQKEKKRKKKVKVTPKRAKKLQKL